MYDKGAGIYVHIPFCVRKCIYCDFLSFQDKEQYVAPYFDALEREIIERSKDKAISGLKFNSVFIGGGTPSMVDPKYILRILNVINNNLSISSDAEITIESNPGTLTDEKLHAFKEAGINRISMGVQSVTDRLLKSLGRIHDFNTVQMQISKVKKYFNNINLDFISAIPKILDTEAESISEVLDCVRFAVSNDVPHVSVYSIISEEGTRLYDLLESGKASFVNDETERLMYHEVKAFLQKNGYNQYEISNFAKPGYASVHNLKYWECLPYVGFGLGSSSYYESDGLYRRITNVSDLDAYINNYSNSIIESLDEFSQKKEFMLLGFRMVKGPDQVRYYDRFGTKFQNDFSAELDSLINDGYIRDDFSLTDKGLDFANYIFRMFL